MDQEQRIRDRAYAIWEAEGRPANCEREHWDRAASEISAKGTAPPAPDTTGTNDAERPMAVDAATDAAGETAASPPPARRKRTAKDPALPAAPEPAKPAAPRASRSRAAKTSK